MAPHPKRPVITITSDQLAAVHLALSFYAKYTSDLCRPSEREEAESILILDGGSRAEYALKRLNLGELPGKPGI